jgi:hypothetical protein
VGEDGRGDAAALPPCIDEQNLQHRGVKLSRSGLRYGTSLEGNAFVRSDVFRSKPSQMRKSLRDRLTIEISETICRFITEESNDDDLIGVALKRKRD